jgi:hypothetical protein
MDLPGALTWSRRTRVGIGSVWHAVNVQHAADLNRTSNGRATDVWTRGRLGKEHQDGCPADYVGDSQERQCVASKEAKRMGQSEGQPANRVRFCRGRTIEPEAGPVYPYPTGARQGVPTPKDVSSVLRNAMAGVLRLAGPDARRSATVSNEGSPTRATVQRANLCKAVRSVPQGRPRQEAGPRGTN